MKKENLQTFLAICVMAIIGSVLTSCADSNAAEQKVVAMATPYILPSIEKITNWDEYIGRFEASERVEIRSRVNGYVESVKFKDGDFVEKGQVLFVVDQRPYYAALKQAEAEKLQAEADLQRTKSDYDRVSSVQDSRAVSTEEVEQRKQIAKSSEARLMAANARLAQAQLDLSYTTIKAPISGKVSEKYVDAGNYISGGSADASLLTTILQVNPMHFYFDASETDFFGNPGASDGKTSTNKKQVLVKLTNETSYDRVGYMDFVDNEIHQTTGTIRGRAVFDNKNMELESGMFGRMRLLGQETEVLLIPEEVITTNQSQKIVYTVGEDNTVQVKPIQIGKLYNHKYRIVLGGLEPGDKVISGNLLKVRPGIQIQPEQKTFKVEPDTSLAAM
ncbi:efflux RND transporter periplasmic adaptor subunit [Flagellimonas sediminis]|uniref:Efflux RND transporter periplasmic adaptor subunit n=1 Tax=Flagellimonas sediminis TaxID=2696468 RepID=A0A6I5KNY9_9FLAO|nr:efflux RND transporter periplasmic adaptor subunit [Allomuricauda sediminis]NDV42594.1 efflux RND transporter periplasmic adaptor subunit [Allomuricauda sediminis]